MGKSAWIFPLVVLALVSGVLGGWVRLGWMALPMPGISSAHGMLMTGSFMGSLISLERSVTMKSKWWLLVPLISVLSAPLFWIGLGNWGMWGLVMASAGMVLMLYFQTMRFKQLENGVMLMGALCWLVGNLLVQQSMFVPMGTGWWIGFILFTILGERLEFGKFLPNPSWSRPLLLLLMGLFWVGLLLPFHG